MLLESIDVNYWYFKICFIYISIGTILLEFEVLNTFDPKLWSYSEKNSVKVFILGGIWGFRYQKLNRLDD